MSEIFPEQPPATAPGRGAYEAVRCDVCGLPDPYNGGGDGIGSCECPRCDGGEAAASSVLCTCPPDDYFDGDASMADFIPEDWRGEAMT